MRAGAQVRLPPRVLGDVAAGRILSAASGGGEANENGLEGEVPAIWFYSPQRSLASGCSLACTATDPVFVAR